MAKTQNQKMKLIRIKEFLECNTDEDHGVTLSEISAHLDACGIKAERKSLYDDIELLREYCHMDIDLQKSGARFEYRLLSRDFDLHELKLLSDAVESSKFITEKKSNELIAKLKKLHSRHGAQTLSRQVLCGKVKNMNESIYYSVDAIFDAIASERCIRFKYFNLSFQKEKEYRRNGNFYEVSPYALTYSEEKYYLIAYDLASEEIRHFRVDRMESISPLDKKRNAALLFSGLDSAKYTDIHFGMFGGELIRVRLELDKKLSGAFFDRFGSENTAISTGNGKFEVSVSVAVSEQFFGWLSGLGTGARIVAPKEIKTQYADFLSKILKNNQ